MLCENRLAHGDQLLAPLLLIGAGGFLGAIARYLLDARITAWTGGSLPWGTFAVNMTGSFVLGLLFALIVERAALPADLRAPLLIGFLGSYTTFSTLALESWRMIEDGAWLYATANLGGSILVGVAAVVAGISIGRAV
jgi:CrcB protein